MSTGNETIEINPGIELPPPPTLGTSARIGARACKSTTECERPTGVKWLRDALSRVERGEGRNDVGMWLAAQLRDDGFDQEEAAVVMNAYTDQVPPGDHPYSQNEAAATLRSVFGKESRPPAGRTETMRPTSRKWPVLSDEALYGLPGSVVNAILPHSEADGAALLAQFLTMMGNVIGRNAYWTAEADEHYGNLFVMLVGRSAKGRKGTSLSQIKNLFTTAAFDWSENRNLSGLSSGEGLIHAVRDARWTKKQKRDEKKQLTDEYENVLDDPGVEDKRLLVTETEFASVLKLMQRDGNIISAIIRQAWDCGDLRVMTKNNPTQATNAHVSIIGHITKDDLDRLLKKTDAANGFANRFLWVCSDRSKYLPEGGKPDPETVRSLSERISAVLAFSGTVTEMRRDEAARSLWHEVYHSLTDGRLGMFGSATGRAEAQVMRLAMLYALGDLSPVIRSEHLHAALALWSYAEASAKYIFGDSTGNTMADRILAELRARPEGIKRSEFTREMFSRNGRAGEVDGALNLLCDLQLAYPVTGASAGGRPAEVWYSTD